MEKSESIKELAKALKDFQGEVRNVTKDAVNPFFKSNYASLENVIATVKPILTKHGLSYTQFPEDHHLVTMLIHESGEYISGTAYLAAKDNTPQGIGSAITYMRRYALSAVLGIATEDDDDGNAATPKVEVKKVEPPKAIKAAQDVQKKLIKDLCDKQNSTLKSAEDYQKCVEMRTGLKLEPANYSEIIKRLEATEQ